MNIYFLMQHIMYFFIPLLIVALGGLFSERSGVVNIALEGMMIIGAFAGIVFFNSFQQYISGQTLMLLGLLVSAAAGMAVALIHAFASINIKADQIISGTSINMFAGAFTLYVVHRMTIGTGHRTIRYDSPQFYIESVPGLGSIPFIGPLFFQNAYITSYLGILLLVAAWFMLYKTRFGLRLRACGEHPQAADSVGINVKKMRYIGVVISGALAGFGGLVYMIPITSEFYADVSGYGFLALAVLIFGQWRPWRILFAAFFFRSLRAMSMVYMGRFGIPAEFYRMLPFVVTLIVLVFTSKRSQAPKAVGVPYDVGKR